MYVIRETFMAKPGQASKLAKMMKEAMGMMPRGNGTRRVLTDFVSNFNTVVIETEVAEMADFDREMKEFMNDPKSAAFREKMKGYTDLYQEGRREIFQTVE